MDRYGLQWLVCMFVVHCQSGWVLWALWSRSSLAKVHVDKPGCKWLNQYSCPCVALWVWIPLYPQANTRISPPPLLPANCSLSKSLSCLSILSTATCEPQRRRSVQDLPGISSESSQVRHSQILEMNGRGSAQYYFLMITVTSETRNLNLSNLN